jgi:tetraacyldisaccharide 4'-kinase
VSRLADQWHRDGWLARAMAPLGWVYGGLLRLRRGLYRRGILKPARLTVPVVVVGNLTVGGTGKTPLVIALAERLRAEGRRPAVVSRGYGRRSKGLQVVSEGDGRRLPVADCGDEPALIADRLNLPVVVAADRAAAARRAAALGADCVVADDGFQRLSLPRARAFVVVDGARGFGNGRCLPAGPLREPVSALADADAVVLHGDGAVPGRQPDLRMRLVPVGLRGIRSRRQSRELDWLEGRRVQAVAGIGDPERFFALLRRLGARVEPHAFPDHHAYTAEELRFPGAGTLVTTDKDAVKLAELGVDGWALTVSARLDPDPGPWLADLPPAQPGGVS